VWRGKKSQNKSKNGDTATLCPLAQEEEPILVDHTKKKRKKLQGRCTQELSPQRKKRKKRIDNCTTILKSGAGVGGGGIRIRSLGSASTKRGNTGALERTGGESLGRQHKKTNKPNQTRCGWDEFLRR